MRFPIANMLRSLGLLLLLAVALVGGPAPAGAQQEDEPPEPGLRGLLDANAGAGREASVPAGVGGAGAGPAGGGGGGQAPGQAPEAPVEPEAPPGQAPETPAAGRLPPGIASEAEQPPAPPEVVEPTPVEEAPPAPAPVEAEAKPRPRAQNPAAAIKTIVGLVLLLALAYIAGHPRIQALERRLGVSQLITAGFPFIALGMVARLPAVGLLSDDTLVELSPLLHLGLGWIGFMIGFRLDARLLDGLPDGTAPKVAFSTGVPFLAVMFAAGLLLLGETGWKQGLRDPVFLRDAIILGTAGAITARSAARFIGITDAGASRMLQIIRLEELAGIIGLTFVPAYFRPQGEAVTWQLPGTAWIFITLGLGATVGLVAYAILRLRVSEAESLVLILGTVAFAAGLASNLLLSPIVVCFVAGVLLVNFPGAYKERVLLTLKRLERPIYLLFLVIVGALWQVDDWHGWALMAVFLVARLGGNWVGINLGWRQGELALNPRERAVLAMAPMGQLSIAIVISALLLYPGGSLPMIVTAVIGAAVVTELLVQLLGRRLIQRSQEAQP